MKRGPVQIAHAIGTAFTHVLNALLWGDAKVSFSARTGYAAYRGKVWGKVMAPVINLLLWSRNHCEEQARESGLIP